MMMSSFVMHNYSHMEDDVSLSIIISSELAESISLARSIKITISFLQLQKLLQKLSWFNNSSTTGVGTA